MPRNFAIRLRCPKGDSDSWVTLSNREESLEQILQQTWEFKCREHGPQQGVPEEAMEVAPLTILNPRQKHPYHLPSPSRPPLQKKLPVPASASPCACPS